MKARGKVGLNISKVANNMINKSGSGIAQLFNLYTRIKKTEAATIRSLDLNDNSSLSFLALDNLVFAIYHIHNGNIASVKNYLYKSAYIDKMLINRGYCRPEYPGAGQRHDRNAACQQDTALVCGLQCNRNGSTGRRRCHAGPARFPEPDQPDEQRQVSRQGYHRRALHRVCLNIQ